MATESTIDIGEQEMEDHKEEMMEDDMELNRELAESYGSPSQDPIYNPHSFLHRAVFDLDDTLKTTYLDQYELGRPFFTVRFMLELYKNALNSSIITSEGKELKLDKLAEYFRQKIKNVTDTGMSNQGFAMNLNVTQKRDTTKRRRNLSNLKNQERKEVNEYGTA